MPQKLLGVPRPAVDSVVAQMVAQSFHQLLDQLAEQFMLLQEQNCRLMAQNSQLAATRCEGHTGPRTPPSTTAEACPWSVTAPQMLCRYSLFDAAPIPLGDEPAKCWEPEVSEGSSRSRSDEHHLSSAPAPELVLLPAWTGQRIPTEPSTSVSNRKFCGDPTWSCSRVVRFGDSMKDGSLLQRCVVRPSSRWQIIWDLMSVIITGYDTLSIPMQVFELTKTKFGSIMNWVVTVFWSLDLVFSFFVGFNAGGVIELRPVKIAKRYLRTWFPLDLVILTIDWVVTLSGSGAMHSFGIIRLSKSLRIVRVLRAFRLLRIVKVMYEISELTELIYSESLLTFIGVAKLMVCILVVNHFIACGWYFIGTLDVHEEFRSWVNSVEDDWGGEPPVRYSYSTSFHWSLTQFTPASMEVVPRNTVERIYAACVLIFALVMFSSFVSSITSAMTRMREIHLEQSRQRERVRRYIQNNRVSLELGNRINSFLKEQGYVTKARATMGDITAFKLLPEPMMAELNREVFMPHILPHPLFHHLHEVESTCLVNACHLAMSEQALVKGQAFFRRGEQATQVIFITRGVSKYFHGVVDTCPTEVGRGGYICEMCLWVPWCHHGQLFAAPLCEFISLDPSKFAEIAREALCYRAIQMYAEQYVEFLTRTCNCEYLSDVWSNFDASQEMAQRAFEMFLQDESTDRDTYLHPPSGILKRMQRRLQSLEHELWTHLPFVSGSRNPVSV